MNMMRSAKWMSLFVVLINGCEDNKPLVEPTEPSSGTSAGESSTDATSTAEMTTQEWSTTGDSCSVEPVPGECNPWCQDCPDGEKCVAVNGDQQWAPPLAWMAKCVPIPENADAIGEACIATDDATDSCDKGARCQPGEVVDNLICSPLCSGNPSNPDCDENTRCVLSDNNVLSVCRTVCNPLTQDCLRASDQCFLNAPDCEGLACLPMGLRDTFYCALQPGGNATEYGEPCGSQFSCGRDLGCVPGTDLVGCADASCCTPYCDLNDNGFSCPESENGMICMPAFSPGTAPVGLEHVGLCRLP